MSAATAAARGRQARVRLGLFPSTATVRRRTSTSGPQDEGTGLQGSTWTDVYTDLPCRYLGDATRTVTVGGIEYQEQAGQWEAPHDTTDLRDGDLVEITAGEWSGTVLSIVEAVKGDQRTARRVPVVEVARPEEWA